MSEAKPSGPLSLIKLGIGLFILYQLFTCHQAISNLETELSPPKQSEATKYVVIQDYSYKMDDSIAKWTVEVRNKSRKDIKDIHFKMRYYSPSGTEVDSGEETVYEVISSGYTIKYQFTELCHKQSVRATIEIDNALWIDEKGKKYLDF